MTLYENDLTPAVYNALRESVGWTPYPADRAATAWNCGWAGCNRYQMAVNRAQRKNRTNKGSRTG